MVVTIRINFNKLSLQSFKSIKDKQILDFDMSEGLYFVTGNNEVEPSLGANGAGKSTIWDGLCWILYGKTSVNLKAGSVKNWYSKKVCEGSVELSIGEVIYKIKRSWNPNKLEIDGKVVTQEEVDILIGAFEDFIYRVYLSFNNRLQFSSKFFDLQPADRLTIFSTVLNLDKWLEYSQKAKSKHENYFNQTQELKENINHISGQITVQNSMGFENQINEWESEREKYLQDCQSRKQELEYFVLDCDDRIKIDNEQLDKFQKQLKVEKSSKISIDNSMDVINNQITELTGLVSEERVQAEDAENSIRRLKNLKGQCPTCKQDVGKKHVQDCVIVLEKTYKTVSDRLSKYVQELTICKNQKHETQKLKLKLDSTLQDMQRVISDLETKIAVLKESKNQHIKGIEDYTKVQKEWKEKINPHLMVEKDRKTKLLGMLQEHEQLIEDLRKIEIKVDQYRSWEKWFKEIRLFVISEAIQDLELSINNTLSSLGMGDWVVKLDVDTETKSGTIKKGFVIQIISPNNNEALPSECWSGGEGQRLRLASTLGFIDFLNDRKGLDWDIEVFDEPTSWLSTEGVNDLLEALYYRAKESNKKVFVVDHRSLDTFGGFSGQLLAEKTENGTILTYTKN